MFGRGLVVMMATLRCGGIEVTVSLAASPVAHRWMLLFWVVSQEAATLVGGSMASLLRFSRALLARPPPAPGAPQRKQSFPVRVTNIHTETKWFQLKETIQTVLQSKEVGYIRMDESDASVATVFFPTNELADAAVQQLNGVMLNGNELSVQLVPKRDRDAKPVTCFNCGREGHINRDCPEPPRPRTERRSAFKEAV